MPHTCTRVAPVHTMVNFTIRAMETGGYVLTIFAFDTVIRTIYKSTLGSAESAAKEWWEEQRK